MARISETPVSVWPVGGTGAAGRGSIGYAYWPRTRPSRDQTVMRAGAPRSTVGRLAVLEAGAFDDGGDGSPGEGDALEAEVAARSLGGVGQPEVAGDRQLAEVTPVRGGPADEQVGDRDVGIPVVGAVALVRPQEPAAPGVEPDALGVGRLGLPVRGVGGAVGAPERGDPLDADAGERAGSVEVEASGVEAGGLVAPAVIGDEVPGAGARVPVDAGQAAEGGVRRPASCAGVVARRGTG